MKELTYDIKVHKGDWVHHFTCAYANIVDGRLCIYQSNDLIASYNEWDFHTSKVTKPLMSDIINHSEESKCPWCNYYYKGYFTDIKDKKGQYPCPNCGKCMLGLNAKEEDDEGQSSFDCPAFDIPYHSFTYVNPNTLEVVLVPDIRLKKKPEVIGKMHEFPDIGERP